MVSDLMQHFSLSAKGLGHLAALYFYAYLLMQLPGGVLLDNVKLRLLLPLSILVCTLGAYLFALSPNLLLAQFGRFLIGLGGAFSAIGTMKLISMYFPANKFAYVSGLMMTCGMLGAVGGQAPLAYLSNLLGWQYALLACCLGGVVLSLLMFMGLNEKQTARKTTQLSMKELASHLKELMRNPQCWLLGLFSGLAFAPVSAFGGLWGVPFLAGKMSLTTTQAATMTSLLFIGFAIGCPLSGHLSDRIGSRKPLMCLGTALSGIVLMIILYYPLHSVWLMTTLLFLFGFFTSFFFLSFAMIREINALLISGTAIGFINTFDAIFGALSEPSVGWILDLNWQGRLVNGARHFEVQHYQIALSLLPMAILIALILSYFIRETYGEHHE
jgi:MFS family permease